MTSVVAEEPAKPSIVSSGLWSATSRLLPALYTLVLSVVAARVLGPERMGRQSFIAFAAATVTTLATGGMYVSVMRHVGESVGAKRWHAVRALLRWALAVEGVAALLGGGLLVAVGVTRDSLVTAWVLAGLTCALLVLQTVPASVLVGLQRWRQASVVGVVTGLAGAAATVTVLALGGGITGMFAVELAVAAVNLAWAARFARRAIAALPASSEPLGDLRARSTRYAAVASVQAVLGLVVWRRSEFFFLARYGGDRQIALYSIAFAATTALSLVPQGLATVLGPAVATMHGAGERDRIAAAFSRGVRVLTVLTLPLTAGVLAVGPLLLRLVYGAEYRAGGRVLLLLMAAFPVLPLYHLGNALLTGVGRQRAILTTNVVAAVANVALDVALIPRHGAAGAAGANAGAQAIGGIVAFALAAQGIRVDWRPSSALRAVVAAVATGGAAYAVSHALGGWAGLLLGIVAGAVAALFVTRLPRDDAEWLRTSAPARLRPVVRLVAR